MRNNSNAILYAVMFSVLLVLNACDSPVLFTKAQPEFSADLIEIPEEYQGTYITEKDSSIVIITDQLIYSQFTEIKLNPVQFHSDKEECYLLDDSTYAHNHKICYNIDYLNKGMIVNAEITKDTLLQLSPFQKIRYHGDELIVSQFSTAGLWYIASLAIDSNEGITYRSINDESNLKSIEDIAKLGTISPIDESAKRYKIVVNTNQFGQLLQDPDIFIHQDYLTRLNFVN